MPCITIRWKAPCLHTQLHPGTGLSIGVWPPSPGQRVCSDECINTETYPLCRVLTHPESGPSSNCGHIDLSDGIPFDLFAFPDHDSLAELHVIKDTLQASTPVSRCASGTASRRRYLRIEVNGKIVISYEGNRRSCRWTDSSIYFKRSPHMFSDLQPLFVGIPVTRRRTKPRSGVAHNGSFRAFKTSQRKACDMRKILVQET